VPSHLLILLGLGVLGGALGLGLLIAAPTIPALLGALRLVLALLARRSVSPCG
jgi:hypothetical protein